MQEVRGVQSLRACLEIQLSFLHVLLPLVIGMLYLTVPISPLGVPGAVVVSFAVPMASGFSTSATGPTSSSRRRPSASGIALYDQPAAVAARLIDLGSTPPGPGASLLER
jgi:hypothetical protein